MHNPFLPGVCCVTMYSYHLMDKVLTKIRCCRLQCLIRVFTHIASLYNKVIKYNKLFLQFFFLLEESTTPSWQVWVEITDTKHAELLAKWLVPVRETIFRHEIDTNLSLIYKTRKINTRQLNLIFINSLQASDKFCLSVDNLCKQFGSRTGPTKCRA